MVFKDYWLSLTLYLNLDKLDGCRSKVKHAENWIGKSTGAEIRFQIDGTNNALNIYDGMIQFTGNIYGYGTLMLRVNCRNPRPEEATNEYIAECAHKSFTDKGEKTGHS